MRQTPAGLSLAPTDLGNFLGCRHLSVLDLGAAAGSSKRPYRYSPVIEELRKRGMEHEGAYLRWLRDKGLAVVDVRGRDAQAAIAEMRSGVDVIYQAALSHDRWAGQADFLQKVPTPSQLGDWSYEVYDTKLARDTRAATILQLCVYSRLLERIQGSRPARMHVVTPGRDFKSLEYRVDDYGAYFRLLAGQMDTFLADPAATYPGARVPLRLLRLVARIARNAGGTTITSATWPAYPVGRSRVSAPRGSTVWRTWRRLIPCQIRLAAPRLHWCASGTRRACKSGAGTRASLCMNSRNRSTPSMASRSFPNRH